MDYQVARIEDYGYKNNNFTKKLWKYISSIIVILTVIIMYASIFLILIQSFNSSTNPSYFTSFTFKWYFQIVSSRALWNSILNTFTVSILATCISTILGVIFAIGINSLSKRNKRIMLLLNNIPLLNADIVTGISLMLVFSFFIKIFPNFFGLSTLLIAHTYFTLPYIILSCLPKLKEIDNNMFDAALDLGLKPKKALIKVIIPAIKAGIFSGMILAFTMSFDDFVVSYYTTGNGFDTLSIWIYASISRKSLTPAVYAFSSLFTFASFIVVIIMNVVKGKMKNEKK